MIINSIFLVILFHASYSIANLPENLFGDELCETCKKISEKFIEVGDLYLDFP